MALTRSLTVVCCLLLVAQFAGCAHKKSGGMDYAYTNGWVTYEYSASKTAVFDSSVHGLYSEFAVIEEKDIDAEGAEIVGTLGEQPVVVDMNEIAPGQTLVMVKVADAGDKAQGVKVHKAIQRYLLY